MNFCLRNVGQAIKKARLSFHSHTWILRTVLLVVIVVGGVSTHSLAAVHVDPNNEFAVSNTPNNEVDARVSELSSRKTPSLLSIKDLRELATRN